MSLFLVATAAGLCFYVIMSCSKIYSYNDIYRRCSQGIENWTESQLLHWISTRVQRNITQSSDGLFISVKTISKYHDARLPPIMLTWFQNVNPSQAN